MERPFHKMIREICEENDIQLTKLSNDWILQMTKDGMIRHITGNRFDINPEASGDIACDKYATFEVLSSLNVPIIDHTILFNPAIRSRFIPVDGNSHILLEFFKNHDVAVVKPNTGLEGNDVSLCHTIAEAESAISRLWLKGIGSLSICPYYDILTEYRCFYLNGEVELIYGKTKPFVIGDGSSTLGKLIESLHLPDKRVVQDNLSKMNLNEIPALGEKVNISWKHNLSGGATAKILEKGQLYQQVEQVAKAAGHAIHMNFATIDVIETVNHEIMVLEINSGVGATIFTETIDGAYEKVKKIFTKAILTMFKK